MAVLAVSEALSQWYFSGIWVDGAEWAIDVVKTGYKSAEGCGGACKVE